MLATPPLEASDEYKHYPVVQFVQNERRLPVLSTEEPGRWLQAGAQPPLYYTLMALLTAGIDTSDLPEVHRLNPHAFVGDPNQIGNKNLIIHVPEQEAFPWQGTVLAIYLIRMASIGLGLGTILLAAYLGFILGGPRVGLLAAALTGFNPMFLFVHAAVNNDSLAILLGSAALYLLVRLWQADPHPRQQRKPFLTLGLVFGLGLLTKLSLGGLLGLALLAIGLRAWSRREFAYFLAGSLWLLIPALVLPLFWFWRNLTLYDDPTGLSIFVAVQDRREGLPTLADWIGEFGTFYRSYWGLFGGVNVAAPEPVYWLFNLLALIGLAGFLIWLWRVRNAWRQAIVANGLWLLPAWVIIIFGLLLRWNLYSAAFQGRLIFPALAAANVLWAIGLLAVFSPLGRRWGAVLIGGLFAGVAALLPWITLQPAYEFPESVASVPEAARFGPMTFYTGNEEVLRLVGVELQRDQRVLPGGEPVEVTLYWQAVARMNEDYLTALALLGRGGEPAGQVNRYPASGMIPTSRWEPGEIWRDRYLLDADADAEAPTRLQIRASIYDPTRGEDLRIADPAGNQLDLLLVGEAILGSVAGEQTPAVVHEVAFQDGIRLQGYELAPRYVSPGETLLLSLYWEAETRPAGNYTLFVHLLDDAGEQIIVADGPPLGGDYPTSLWQPGEQVVETRTLVLPPGLPAGNYRLVFGFYDPGSGERLPRVGGEDGTVTVPVQVQTP